MKTRLVVLAGAALLASASRAVAASPSAPSTPVRKPPSVAPLASGAVSVHSPYSTGECSLCHEGKDPKKPGPARRPVNKTCYFCHEDLGAIMTGGKFKHATAVESCTNCHNPHNSREKKLLVAKVPELCLDCHATTRTSMAGSVKHAALSEGSSCGNCHSPHASEVEHVLLRLPYDQCIGCHDKDDVKDAKGKPLTNIKKLLAENPVHHAPVAQKDCSSCHETHGSNHVRLAVAEYPAQFYAPFEPANYALCFKCHDERAVTMPETLTETRFRDGKRNLHFVHVNKADRGRICRACHEVHAAKQAYLIRDSVPYGSSGWLLQVGFTKNADGGTCDKTCHTAKTYVNTLKTAAKVGG